MFSETARAFRGEATLSYRHGAILVAGSGVLFSFTGLFFRGLENATDLQFLMLRGASTAMALGLVAFARRSGKRPVRFRGIGWRIVLASVLLASMSMLYILALARTSVAIATFFLAAAPFSGAFWGWTVLRERINGVTWVAMFVALVGIGVMVADGVEGGSTTGVLFAAMIPLILGLYNVLIRSADTSVDPIVPGIIAGTLLGIGAGIAAATRDGLDLSTRDVVLGLAAGALVLGIGLPLFNMGHRSVPTAQVSLLNLTEIVLSPLWVWMWPGETPSAGTLLGGAIVLTAVVALVTSGHGPRRRIRAAR